MTRKNGNNYVDQPPIDELTKTYYREGYIQEANVTDELLNLLKKQAKQLGFRLNMVDLKNARILSRKSGATIEYLLVSPFRAEIRISLNTIES